MLRVARPIDLDKREIARVVSHDLMPQIVRRAERHPRQDEPIGETRGWASAQITVAAADGRDTITVAIEVESERSRVRGVAVLGGKSNPTTGVTLYLNGGLTPADLHSEERTQPLHACKHEKCIPYGLYSILLHELTHVAEEPLRKRRTPTYSPSDERGRAEPSRGYINDPSEVRAFMQQIVDEVEHNADNDMLREHLRGDRHGFLDAVLSLSTTWSLVEKQLSPSNRARILKSVYDVLDRKGLLDVASARTARVALRYFTWT